MVISLRTLLEYAIEPATRKDSGNVQSFEKLFTPDALGKLDLEHQGAYALLLFHPAADSGIAEYVSNSSVLASDSGPRIMTFFTLGAPARAPIPLAWNKDPWLVLDQDIHPAYTILRQLFRPKIPPAIPGIVFLGSLDIDEESVYVPLPDIRESADARHRIATALAAADRAMGKEFQPKSFADDVSLVLLKANIPYVRSGRAATREFLLRAFRIVTKHKGDIVTGIKFGMGKQ
jgi:hypothetical protein